MDVDEYCNFFSEKTNNIEELTNIFDNEKYFVNLNNSLECQSYEKNDEYNKNVNHFDDLKMNLKLDSVKDNLDDVRKLFEKCNFILNKNSKNTNESLLQLANNEVSKIPIEKKADMQI